jgi:hypothetical protein
MTSAFNDKYGRYKTTLADTLVQFNTIMNIPFKIAYDMYIRDEWFDNPYESKTFADEIYVTIVKKDDNLNVKVFKRRTRPDDSYFVEKPDEKKVFDFLKQGLLPPKKIINICYAVMRAKDIYLFFVDYKNKYKSFPASADRINYLYHCGWVMSTDLSVLENDELVKFLNKKTYGGIDIIKIQNNLRTSFNEDKLFETDYFKQFQKIFKLGKFDARMIKESEIANLYINNILPPLPPQEEKKLSLKFGGFRKKLTIRKNKKDNKKKSKKHKSKK